jgi:hypothetical protein
MKMKNGRSGIAPVIRCCNLNMRIPEIEMSHVVTSLRMGALPHRQNSKKYK